MPGGRQQGARRITGTTLAAGHFINSEIKKNKRAYENKTVFRTVPTLLVKGLMKYFN
jgi:hypothetical protein